MRKLLILIILVPVLSYSDDWDQNYISQLFDGRQLDPIEGIWQFAHDGASIAIVKDTPTTFNIYIVDTPILDIKPGAQIGTAVKAPADKYYDCKLSSGNLGHKNKIKGETVTINVNDNGTLTIKPYKTGYSVSFNRWLSSILHIRVIDNTGQRPSGLDGARRIYPQILSDHYPICL